MADSPGMIHHQVTDIYSELWNFGFIVDHMICLRTLTALRMRLTYVWIQIFSRFEMIDVLQLIMRILSAFFAVLFTFINPCMLYKVVSELESSFSHNLPEKIRSRFLEIICTYFIDNNLASKLRLVVYMSVLLFTLLHLIATSLCLYGHYSCRPAFFRPFLVDAALSFVSVYCYRSSFVTCVEENILVRISRQF
ncbi:hypothetical protein COOONC_15562 [Cooperia oncophora]